MELAEAPWPSLCESQAEETGKSEQELVLLLFSTKRDSLGLPSIPFNLLGRLLACQHVVIHTSPCVFRYTPTRPRLLQVGRIGV